MSKLLEPVLFFNQIAVTCNGLRDITGSVMEIFSFFNAKKKDFFVLHITIYIYITQNVERGISELYITMYI